MFDQLKISLRKWVPCSEAELDLFVEITQPLIKTYKRKEFLIREGEICKYVYFINTGCIRYFYNINGLEKTGQFFFENGWYADLNSFISQSPSEMYIQTLEPSEIILIPQHRLYRLYDEVPIFERFGRLFIERSFIALRERNNLIANYSPQDRYLKLIQERPKLLKRVSQRYIASYLGLEPESLSRIRKRLLQKD